MGGTDASIASLRTTLSGRVETDPGTLRGRAPDASAVLGVPDAIVHPEGFEDLVRLVAWARLGRVPLVARGAGSSLDGESVAVRGGILVDFSGWNQVLEVDREEGLARVQPGVVNRALDAEVRSSGWTYPPNPGSAESCTLGGNVATNASGPRSFRHGPTRAWVRALEVVDGNAARWVAGGRARKSSVGPDLLSMLVGSEGTLALFGEITLRLARIPERRTGLGIPVPGDRPLGAFCLQLRATLGGATSALEFLDPVAAAALPELFSSAPAGPGGLVLAEIEGTAAQEAEALERLAQGSVALGLPFEPSVFPSSDRLWSIRGRAGPAIEGPLGLRLREDVAVPLVQLDALLGGLRIVAERRKVPVVVFGHLGDGNLHPVFGIDPATEEAAELRRELLDLALSLGGAISGEHGIGATKRDRLAAQLGAPGLAALRALKASLDPFGILNPGKLLPEVEGGAGATPSGSPWAGGAPRTPPA
jgi:FAD/FMN-containing dehydrogenase